jgi:hypothetical protein
MPGVLLTVFLAAATEGLLLLILLRARASEVERGVKAHPVRRIRGRVPGTPPFVPSSFNSASRVGSLVDTPLRGLRLHASADAARRSDMNEDVKAPVIARPKRPSNTEERGR